MKHNFYHTELNENGLPILVKEGRYYEADKRKTYMSPDAVFNLCKGIGLNNMTEEYVYAVFLNTAGRLIGFSEISHGTIDSSLIAPRSIAQKALLFGAKNIILIHNHPSGVPNPSKSDIAATTKVKNAMELIDIKLCDHIIIGDDIYYSFCENQQI